ncbi:MAG: hypothetical protein ABUT39_30010 [Acidobacteriota bacterium]
MIDGERPQGGSDSDRLRQEAYEQEAEALREDLVRYFAQGAALDELGEPLRKAIQEALKQVVKEAFLDQDVRVMIRNQVRDTVLTGVRNELAAAQSAIIADLKRDLIPKWNQTLKSTMRPDSKEVAPPQEKRSKKARQQEELAESEIPNEFEEWDERRPPTIPQDEEDTKPRRPGMAWALKLAALVLGLLVVVLLTWLLIRTFQPRDDKDNEDRRASTEQERTASDPNAEEERREEEARQAPETGVDAAGLREEWISRMEAAKRGLASNSPLRESLKRQPPGAQFDCWFDQTGIRQLEGLLAHPEMTNRELRSKLQGDVFDPCLQDYSLELPVFGAQALVHVALQRRQEARWQGCPDGRRPDGIPDLAEFETDGKRGPGTYGLLNGYLACSGHASQLTLGDASTVPDYLFTLYAALKELSQGG